MALRAATCGAARRLTTPDHAELRLPTRGSRQAGDPLGLWQGPLWRVWSQIAGVGPPGLKPGHHCQLPERGRGSGQALGREGASMLHIRSKIGKGAIAAAVSAAVVGLREPLL
jgi:hypothetical protein